MFTFQKFFTEKVGEPPVELSPNEWYVETAEGIKQCLRYSDTIYFYIGQTIDAAASYIIRNIDFQSRILDVEILTSEFGYQKGAKYRWKADDQAKVLKRMRNEEELNNSQKTGFPEEKKIKISTLIDWGVLGIIADNQIYTEAAYGKKAEEFEKEYYFWTKDDAKSHLKQYASNPDKVGYYILRSNNEGNVNHLLFRVKIYKNPELYNYIWKYKPELNILERVNSADKQYHINSQNLIIQLFKLGFRLGRNSSYDDVERILQNCPNSDFRNEFLKMWRISQKGRIK